MSTEYAIRCTIHDASWPESARRYQLPALEAIIDNRSIITSFEQLYADAEVSVVFAELGAPGDFLRSHRSCELAIFDEYGRRRPWKEES